MEQLTLFVDILNLYSDCNWVELSRSGHIVILTSETAQFKMWLGIIHWSLLYIKDTWYHPSRGLNIT